MATPPRKRQGPRITGTASAIDLDKLIADRTLEPATIRLFGEEFKVRRDFTPAEAVQWLDYMHAPTVTVEIDGAETEVPGEAAAWGMLLGDMGTGRRMNTDLETKVAREHVRIIADEVIRTAGLGDLVGLGPGER